MFKRLDGKNEDLARTFPSDDELNRLTPGEVIPCVYGGVIGSISRSGEFAPLSDKAPHGGITKR